MRRYVFTLVAALLLPLSLVAQNEMAINVDSLARVPQIKADSLPWKWFTKWGAGFSTTQLTNWTQGGQEVYSLDLSCLASYDYADSVQSWDNDLHLRYGVVKQGQQRVQKSDDQIILSSRISHITSHWYRLTGFADFRTQFVDGFNNSIYDSASGGPLRISSFFAPAFLTTAFGIDAAVLPQVRVLVAPLSSRSTWVLDSRLVESGRLSQRGVFGLPPGESARTRIGTVVNVKMDIEVADNVNLRTRFNGFMPYATPQLWVVNIENAVIMQVNEWLNVSWLADVFYDDRIPITRTDGTVGPATQFRNQITVGINWSVGG